MIPTVVRGHNARPGSPAETHLLARDAIAWGALVGAIRGAA